MGGRAVRAGLRPIWKSGDNCELTWGALMSGGVSLKLRLLSCFLLTHDALLFIARRH